MSRLVRELRLRADGGSLLKYAGQVIAGLLRDVVYSVLTVKPSPKNLVLLADVIAHPLLVVGIVKPTEKLRSVSFRNGLTINYTRNQGDIHTISEIFFKQIYAIPDGIPADIYVDLGANIGMASLHFFQKHKPSKVICVEPSPRNLSLLRQNVSVNALPVIVLEGVISESPGEMKFEIAVESNAGHIGESGVPVRAFSMEEVLAKTPNRKIDVLKIDVEGYEETLLRVNNSWLNSVGCIMIEFHDRFPGMTVDKDGLITILMEKGFTHVPSKHPTLPDTFVRR